MHVSYFQIVLLGSDGIKRPFLCKPKDDLRKDSRMMEFTAMINRLLSKYPESRRRKLYIRTFAVIPLTEDCGMVEWVPHTRGLRNILQDVYISCGKFDRQKTNPQIKRIYDQFQGKIPEDEMLKTKILPMFPPVFHKWFLTTFSEPAAWFRARVAYAHTTAVWSMVGHIVGLGDRHGENILFDSTTGDCVHVDFSCLFDKGLLLEKPELVPFRLTQVRKSYGLYAMHFIVILFPIFFPLKKILIYVCLVPQPSSFYSCEYSLMEHIEHDRWLGHHWI